MNVATPEHCRIELSKFDDSDLMDKYLPAIIISLSPKEHCRTLVDRAEEN